MSNIVTGEKIQQLCDIYLGLKEHFMYNPNISKQTEKHFDISLINNSFNNPSKIFCYSDCINLLSTKIHFFQNDFILITHNSDDEIRNTNEIKNILNCNKLLKWFGQNICIEHSKLFFLPIGLANSQWVHGNLSLFYNENFINNLINNKTNNVYFNFKFHTNPNKRQLCFESLKDKLVWLNTIDPIENQKRLSTYKFCICPEGNGADTHRLWECLYLKVVPVVIKSEFTSILEKQNIPLVILENWSDFNVNKLNYNDFNFNSEKLIDLLSFNSYISKLLI